MDNKDRLKNTEDNRPGSIRPDGTIINPGKAVISTMYREMVFKMAAVGFPLKEIAQLARLKRDVVKKYLDSDEGKLRIQYYIHQGPLKRLQELIATETERSLHYLVHKRSKSKSEFAQLKAAGMIIELGVGKQQSGVFESTKDLNKMTLEQLAQVIGSAENEAEN